MEIVTVEHKAETVNMEDKVEIVTVEHKAEMVIVED